MEEYEPTYEEMIKHRLQELADLMGVEIESMDCEIRFTRKVAPEILASLDREPNTYNWYCPDCRTVVDIGRYDCPFCGLELSNLHL